MYKHATNYNSSAVEDDGSCLVYGCANSAAMEIINSEATVNQISSEDDSNPCIVLGCSDTLAINYDSLVTDDDGSCIYELIYGYVDPSAFNYVDTATINQISAEDTSNPCRPYVYGCVDSTFVEYYDNIYSIELQFVISGPTDIADSIT